MILKKSIVFALFASILTSAGFSQDSSIEESDAGIDVAIAVDEILADFDALWQAIQNQYVDPGFGGADWEALRGEYRERVEVADGAVEAYGVISELVGELGNELTFVVPPWLRPADEPPVQREEGEVELQYAGVGILLQQMQNGDVWVLQVFRDTPAESAGVLIGDVIAGVEDWRVEGDDAVSQISSRVRGPIATDVRITLRDPDGAERDVTITRGEIDLRPSVEYRTVESSFGYLRIPALTEQLVAEASKALPSLLRSRYLLFDLRNVASGTVEGMTQVAQWFLGSARLGGFVSREGAIPLPFRHDSIAAYQRPVAILVNSGTYGVGEMLAKILRDYKRGPVVGNPTQGGFQIGELVDLPSGGVLHMTVGLYVSPTNELLPIHGIRPDTVVELPDLKLVRSGVDVYIDSAIEMLRSNPRL